MSAANGLFADKSPVVHDIYAKFGWTAPTHEYCTNKNKELLLCSSLTTSYELIRSAISAKRSIISDKAFGN
jgi:hypothetical protein